MCEPAESPTATADLPRLGRDELIAALIEGERQLRVDYARQIERIAEATSRNLAAEAGYRNLVELLRDTVHVTRDEGRRRLTHAAAVVPGRSVTGAEIPAPLPATGAALAEGLVGAEQVQAIAALHRVLPDTVDPQDWEQTEATLAELATTADAHAVAKAARYARAYLDPDGPAPDDREAARLKRELRLCRRFDGSADGRFHLDPDTMALFDALLSPLAKPRPSSENGRDTRSLAERQGDAFADIIRLAFGAPEIPTEAGERPHMLITLRLEDLREQVGRALLHGASYLTATEARRYACDATIIPLVLGSHSEPLDIGRATRVINTVQRRALIARDRGCAFPNCERPAKWCDGHHLWHWADGGHTDIDNLTLLCSTHHQLMHDEHCEWRIRMIGGKPEFIPPKFIDPEQKPRRNTLHPTLE